MIDKGVTLREEMFTEKKNRTSGISVRTSGKCKTKINTKCPKVKKSRPEINVTKI